MAKFVSVLLVRNPYFFWSMLGWNFDKDKTPFEILDAPLYVDITLNSY